MYPPSMPLIDPIIDDSEFNSSGEQNLVLFLHLRHILEIRAVRTWREQDADVHAFTGSHPDTMPARVKASRQVPGVWVCDFSPLRRWSACSAFSWLALASFSHLRACPSNRSSCPVPGRRAAPNINRQLRLPLHRTLRLRDLLLRGIGVGGVGVGGVGVVRHPCLFLSCCPCGRPSGGRAAPVFMAGHGIAP